MFKKAVQNHNASAPQQKATQQQKSHLNSFRHAPGPPPHAASRPLSTGSGNVSRHHTSPIRRTSGSIQGTKRTLSGQVKAPSPQEDAFEYPTLNISEVEADLPAHIHPIPGRAPPPPVMFDENDFDSDLDLDVEDPASKSTVVYPKLPSVKPMSTARDSGYGSIDRDIKEARSSQPIPWSSSPVEHFKTPVKQAVQPTKRRHLPWAKGPAQTVGEVDTAPEDEAEEEEVTAGRPQKRRSTHSTGKTDITPLPKDSAKNIYPWNTTASAVKQQQKNLREANKKLSKANEGTEDEMKKAMAKKNKNTVHSIFLSEEQQQILNMVVENKKSVFFTGSAGTGKSVLLREIIAALRKKYIREPDRVAVTASTGLAACNIGGITLHSFAGIGLGKEPAEDLVKKIRKNVKSKQKWLRTKVLIIDEVSMIDGDLFDKLEQIARTLRNNGRPFGGIQLIITGDFFQLPPVGQGGRQAKFAFDAGTWTTSIEHTIGLHHVFRQKDPVFAGMLNEMREGRLTPTSIAEFRKLSRPLPASDDNLEATELFPTRVEVDRANNLRMHQLHGDIFAFDARDGGTLTDINQRTKLLSNCIAPEVVQLKKGAQVMLIKNMDDTLVNGSLGKVTGFMTEQMFVYYKENEEAFLDGDEPEGPTESEVRAQQKASILGVNTQQVYPVVRFAIADGTTRDLLCKREPWKYEQPNGEVLASREQIPLILAWALSIHKAQGQTLERVRVDLGKAFEKGQAYVALSRATHMAGLQVMRFDPSKVVAHPKVRIFYSQLSKVEDAQENAKTGTIQSKMQRSKAPAAANYEKDFVDN